MSHCQLLFLFGMHYVYSELFQDTGNAIVYISLNNYRMPHLALNCHFMCAKK